MTTPKPRAFERVLIIMFENMYRSYVMKNDYMRGLAEQGIDMANYFGVMHPSQTNYIASLAGELCNVTDDNPPSPLPQHTLVDLIEAAGLVWGAYMESYDPQLAPWEKGLVPQNAFPYVIKHNAFSSFARILDSRKRWGQIQNEHAFFEDVAAGVLPSYAWFTPNMWSDGHYSIGTQKEPAERAPALVDQQAIWLRYFFDMLRFPGPDSRLPSGTLVVVTYDESDFEADWDEGKKYTYDGPNQIYTVLLGDMIKAGREEEGYNHYSLIKTVEQNFELGDLGKNDADANWFRFLWGEGFEWHKPQENPLPPAAQLATAEAGDKLGIVSADATGMSFRSFDGFEWSEARPLTGTRCRSVAMCPRDDGYMLAYADDEGLHTRCLDADGRFQGEATRHTSGSSEAFDIVAFDDAQRLMLVWRDVDDALQSRQFATGAWSATSAVGHSSDGDLCLAVLGPSLYLIAESVGCHEMMVISFNSAKFNVVTLKASTYAGPYDDTTRDLWSPSAFPVATFAHMASPVTPGEDEPATQPHHGRGPLSAATLDGCIHLAYR